MRKGKETIFPIVPFRYQNNRLAPPPLRLETPVWEILDPPLPPLNFPNLATPIHFSLQASAENRVSGQWQSQSGVTQLLSGAQNAKGLTQRVFWDSRVRGSVRNTQEGVLARLQVYSTTFVLWHCIYSLLCPKNSCTLIAHKMQFVYSGGWEYPFVKKRRIKLF